MKSLGRLIGVFAVLGFLTMVPLGCSDSDSSSPVSPTIPTNRVYVMNAADGTLAPVAETTGEGTVSATEQSWEYTLILEDVSDDIFWFTDRPERDSGNETTEYFIQTVWPEIYVKIAPNSILDGRIPPNELNDGLFLALRTPVYDSAMKQLTFNVTLLNSTMNNKHPENPVTFENIKMTINDNNPDNQVVEWSFAQVAALAILEPEGTEGKYTLNFENIYPECYYMSNAPDRYSVTYTVALFTDTWNNHFGDVPPNASITSYTSEGEVQVNAFVLENPVYDSENNRLTYTATILNGAMEEPDEYLYFPTLFIDGAATASCDKNFTGRLTIQNGSTESIWIVETSPGAPGSATAAQWDWWVKRYGEKYEIKGGKTEIFCVPDGGAPGGNFRFRMGCDANGDNCKLGDDTGPMAGINTLFEPSFGCKFNKNNEKDHAVAGCAFNPSANVKDFPNFPGCLSNPTLKNCPSIGYTDFFDVSTVDGYTMPMFLEVKGTNCKDDKGPRTTTDASMLDIASCPSDGKATLYSDNEKQNALIQKDAGISWLTKSGEYLQGCVSPCHWFTGGGIGDPVNPDPSPLPDAPPYNSANYYCCHGTPGPQDGSGACAKGPTDSGKTYPITLTNYVKSLKALGYKGYTWQYDDLEGTMTCDWGEQISLTLVPDGGVPYDPATKWAYNGKKCSGGKKGSYSSRLACQQANMKYKCVPETYATGPTVNYCIVDPQGTMTWDACQSSCTN